MNKFFLMSVLSLMVVASAFGAERDEEQRRCCLHRLFRKDPGIAKPVAAIFAVTSVAAYCMDQNGQTAVQLAALTAASFVAGAALEDALNTPARDEEAPRLRRRKKPEYLAADVWTGRKKGS